MPWYARGGLNLELLLTLRGAPLARAREESDPYGQALALLEIAYAQAMLGAEDAAQATFEEASELAPEIRSEN